MSNFLIIIHLNWYFITDNGGSAQGVELGRKKFGNTTNAEKLAGMGPNDNCSDEKNDVSAELEGIWFHSQCKFMYLRVL